ncbi:hypothetical protein V3C99_005454 [Haemonchus contortus]
MMLNKTPPPLSWVRAAGSVGETTNFRAEMSSLFWDHFLSHGRLNLAEYNRSHKSSIKIVRGKSFQHDDMENLGLYLRQKIRKLYIDRGQQPSEINRFKSPILSVLLGLDYSEWNGTPIRQLLSQSELNSYENGVIKWGSLDIDILLQETIGKIPVVQDSTVQNVQTRKRESSSSNDVINKRARNTPNINIDADVTTIT